MTEDAWSGRVLAAFSASAAQYDAAAGLQRAVAWRLAGLCHRQAIPRGVWMDLGSGTGRLADDLEHLHPGQSVLRVDGSAAMLSRHGPTAKTRLLDLNQALPKSTPAATLLCSSFVLHWLEAPAETLQHWFQQLDDGGWLALAVPVAGSFWQWHAAAATSGVPCTALAFPDQQELLRNIPRTAIRHQQLHRFSRSARRPLDLLRPMITTGAGTSRSQGLGPVQWRRLARAWPDPLHPSLTWHVLTLMLRR